MPDSPRRATYRSVRGAYVVDVLSDETEVSARHGSRLFRKLRLRAVEQISRDPDCRHAPFPVGAEFEAGFAADYPDPPLTYEAADAG